MSNMRKRHRLRKKYVTARCLKIPPVTEYSIKGTACLSTSRSKNSSGTEQEPIYTKAVPNDLPSARMVVPSLLTNVSEVENADSSGGIVARTSACAGRHKRRDVASSFLLLAWACFAL